MVYTRSMARRINGEEVREAMRDAVRSHPVVEPEPETESDDSTFVPSESGDESVGSNSVSEDVSITLGSETRSASSTDTDLSGFIVRDDQTCIDEATSRSPPTHATVISRTERLEREVAEILRAMRRR